MDEDGAVQKPVVDAFAMARVKKDRDILFLAMKTIASRLPTAIDCWEIADQAIKQILGEK